MSLTFDSLLGRALPCSSTRVESLLRLARIFHPLSFIRRMSSCLGFDGIDHVEEINASTVFPPERVCVMQVHQNRGKQTTDWKGKEQSFVSNKQLGYIINRLKKRTSTRRPSEMGMYVR